MLNRLNLIAGIAALFALVPGPSLAQSIDESFYYKLSTQFRGDGMKLDVFNGGPKNNRTRLEPDQDVSGQFWKLVGDGDGTFRLSTLFRGQNMCLDIFNGGSSNNEPHLTRCGNFTGQFWNLYNVSELLNVGFDVQDLFVQVTVVIHLISTLPRQIHDWRRRIGRHACPYGDHRVVKLRISRNAISAKSCSRSRSGPSRVRGRVSSKHKVPMQLPSSSTNG
jgi:hypothetical protein